MSRALIGVGGTGAKILESFTFLSIMGLPSALELHEVHMRMVDTDDKNRNKERLEVLLKLYNKGGLYSLLSSFANGDKEKRWNPAPIKHERLRTQSDSEQTNYNSEFFWDVGLNKIGTFGAMLADKNLGGGSDFLRMLYSNDDQNVPLIEGCHGKPRIGAISYEHYFITDVQTKGDESFWNSLHGVALKHAMAQDNGKIMFAGSIFGGTGASGIPTLAKCFYDHFFGAAISSEIGLTFMLPYYTYDDTGACKAQSSEFALNSKLALRYYHDSGFLDNIEKAHPSIYLIGQNAKPMFRADGEEADTKITEQENPALPAEIVAAFSAMHFFRQPFVKGKKVNVVETSGQEGTLEALPNICFTPKGNVLNKLIGNSDRNVSVASAIIRLKMFSALWLTLRKHKPISANITNVPFHNSFHAIQNEQARSWKEHLEPIDIFCDYAIEWLSQLEANGLDLDDARKLFSDIRSLDEGNKLLGNISLNNKSITDFYLVKIGEVEREINKKYKNYNDYIKLLFATMQVCCNIVKY